MDVIHKNLEARLEQLETRTSHILTDQQNYQNQDAKHLTDDQHLINSHHQSVHYNQTSQDSNQHLHTDQCSQILHTDPLMNNDPILIDQHDNQPVHSSEPVITHNQERLISTHVQHSREQSPISSSVDYSSSDDESSNISSNVSSDNEMNLPSSTVHPQVNSTIEETTSCVIHKSTSSGSSVLSDSCVSDSESGRCSVEADGRPHYGDKVTLPLETAVSYSQDDQQKMHASITSNLTTVTPTELSSPSDDESNEQQSNSGEDNKEQVEIEMATNSESSEGLETSSVTSVVVTQSLLNKDESTEQHQPVTNNLRDITNGLSQPPPAMLHQEDILTSTLPPSSHSPVQKSPPKRSVNVC